MTRIARMRRSNGVVHEWHELHGAEETAGGIEYTDDGFFFFFFF